MYTSLPSLPPTPHSSVLYILSSWCLYSTDTRSLDSVCHSGTQIYSGIVSHSASHSGTLMYIDIASHSGTLLYLWRTLHSEPFRHANVQCHSKPFWHTTVHWHSMQTSHSGTLHASIYVLPVTMCGTHWSILFPIGMEQQHKVLPYIQL